MGKYFDTYRLTVGNFDCKDHILISSILDLFQDIAGKHASNNGYGYEDLVKKNKFWVVLRTKYKVLKDIPQYEDIKVSTWTNEPSKIDVYRHYEIYDKDGNLLVIASSQWVVVDLSSRRLIKINDVIQDKADVESAMAFNGRMTKLDDFSLDNVTKVTCITHYLDLDHNGHVNNIKYGDFILNYIPELHNVTIEEFQIDYVHEMRKDDEFNLFYKVETKQINIIGRNEEKVFFIAKVTLK